RVVIPSYQRPALLRRLLMQLAAQTAAQEFDVHVVDDGSERPVGAAVADLRLPIGIRLHRQPNAGAAAARHAGVLAAQGQLILFLDDDMQVGREFVEQHLRAHQQHGRAVVLGRIRADPSLATMPLIERWHATLLDRKAAQIAAGILPVRSNLMFTGNVSLRREDYLAVGGFDTSLGNSEDVELGLRLEKAGVPFVFSEAAFTLHGSDHHDLLKWRRRARRYGVFDHRIAAMHPELRHASPWRFAFDLHPIARPFVAASVLAPPSSRAAAAAVAGAACLADRAGLGNPAIAATPRPYAIEYFSGVREEAGSVEQSARELARFAARFETGMAGAAARALNHLREE